MTLHDFFNLLGEHPSYVLLYFTLVPVTAALAGFMGQGEGHISPWRELYSALIYLVCVPGILGTALTVYLFLFERRSILETDVLSQILPFFSMVVTLLIIRRNVSFDDVPGFNKISSLVVMITATFAFMWFLDRTHIYAISYIPFWQVLVIFVVLFLIIRWTWSRLFNRSTPSV